MKLTRPFALSAILLLAGLLFSANSGGCASSTPPAGMVKAPDFTLPVFSDGPERNLTLSHVNADRPVLLVFWASWCPTCVSEISEINTWQKRYKATGVKVIGINLEETADRIRRIQTRYPMDYEVVMDQDGSVAESYSIDSLPTLVLLAKGGEILYYGFQLPRELERMLTA